jgi:hypothetical protein
MLLSKTEFEALLRRLREQRTESPTIDGKANLPLETEGDRAYFIRHTAALANNVEPSYLIIGIEDKTWNPIGLSSDSPLHSPDQTQQRMNQILANRLDPNLFVRYCTYEVSGVLYGLVAVEGKRAPYIIAIEDQQYGGDRTQGAPSYLYRGSIYIRRGASSLVANRQSEVLGVINKAQATDASQPDRFLIEHNYLDVQSQEFGHHPLAECLVEMHSKKDAFGGEYVKAESWVSFLFHPVNGSCEVDTVELKDKLKPDQRIGRGPEWYHGVPNLFVRMLYDPRATPREFVAGWHPSSQDGDNFTHFILIQPSGYIEIGCTCFLFLQSDSTRFFNFVNIVGYLWQMIYLAQAIYRDIGFYGEVANLVNLIGTKDTRLSGYAESQRGGWASPFSFEYTPSRHDVCQDLNIQIKRTLQLAESSNDEIEAIVRDIAKDVGAYYGQDRPRCFDYCTNEFPVRQYIR